MRCTSVINLIKPGALLRAVSVLALLASLALQAEEPQVFDLDNEVVCRVNTEAVSKRQVEERMEEVAIRLNEFRKQQEKAGLWNKETEDKWNEMYIPEFRNALRRVVKERMMLQYGKIEKTPIDERAYEKRVKETVDRLKGAGVFGVKEKGYTLGEVQKRVRENMLLDNFRYQFSDVLQQPSRPEVQRFYEENIRRYQRKAGVKVRIIRIDRFLTNKLTGKQTVREDSHELAEKLREDIIQFGASFKEVARVHSDDEESKKRDGLIQIDPKDEYIDIESYNRQIADSIRGLKPGELSKVFELLQTSWAFVMLEGKRESGPAPLEGDLFEEIYVTLSRQKTQKKEDEWFRKALSKSLVVHVVDAVPKTLPIEFFFPDDKVAELPKPDASKTEQKAKN
jgi:hypothetical protein